MRNVALLGRAGAGKDSVASVLSSRYGHVRVAFADAVRSMALAVNPIIAGYADVGGVSYFRLSDVVDIHGWDGAKRAFPEVRRFLQRLGSEGVRDTIHPDTWIVVAQKAVSAAWDAGRFVVITDVRFPNEVAYARRHGFLTVWVDRPGQTLHGEGADHASEQLVSAEDADVILYNGGTLEDLPARVSATLFGVSGV